MGLSIYASQALLNAFMGKTSNFGTLSGRPTLYFAFSTADPGEDGSGAAEPSGNGYARVATAPADWADATNADPSVVTNVNNITFPNPTGPWGSCTHGAVYDAASGGNFVAGGPLAQAIAPDAPTPPVIAAGQASLSLD
ncbi:MAG: hypothetical protein AAFX44_06600 [Pseudomonadota bacterium]